MPTTLRNFAAMLAAVGLLSFGSMTMGQQDQPQPPSNPSSLENIERSADVADVSPPPIEESAPDAATGEADANADKPSENISPKAEADANTNDVSNAEDTHPDNQNQSDQSSAEQRDEDRQSSPPEVPEQARDQNVNAHEARDADWRTVRHEGMMWYYAPNGQWHIRSGNHWQVYHDGAMPAHRNANGTERSLVRDHAPQRHSTGYRGEQTDPSKSVHENAPPLRYDRCGRPYICVNGRAVYVEVTESSQHASTSDQRQPTMADEQYQEVPPPPAMEEGSGAVDQASGVPSPPTPPSGN